MTDGHADRDPGRDRNRVRESLCGAREPDRTDEEEGEHHRRREAVDPTEPGAAGNAVREDDVGGEERRVGEGEGDSDRLALELHVRE